MINLEDPSNNTRGQLVGFVLPQVGRVVGNKQRLHVADLLLTEGLAGTADQFDDRAANFSQRSTLGRGILHGGSVIEQVKEEAHVVALLSEVECFVP